MAIATEDLRERKWREGNSFGWIDSEIALASLAAVQYVVCNTSNKAAVFDTVHLESNSEILSWEGFTQPTLTAATGTALTQLRRNASAIKYSGITILKDPTITDDGQPFFPNPIDIVAQVAAGNRAYITEDIVTDLFTIPPGVCYLFKITNSDAQARKCNIQFNIFTE